MHTRLPASLLISLSLIVVACILYAFVCHPLVLGSLFDFVLALGLLV